MCVCILRFWEAEMIFVIQPRVKVAVYNIQVESAGFSSCVCTGSTTQPRRSPYAELLSCDRNGVSKKRITPAGSLSSSFPCFTSEDWGVSYRRRNRNRNLSPPPNLSFSFPSCVVGLFRRWHDHHTGTTSLHLVVVVVVVVLTAVTNQIL